MQYVVSILKKITSVTSGQSDIVVDKVDEENDSNSSLDINMISLLKNIEHEGTSSLESVNNLSIATGSTNMQANSLEMTLDNINNIVADKLIKNVIKEHDQVLLLIKSQNLLISSCQN